MRNSDGIKHDISDNLTGAKRGWKRNHILNLIGIIIAFMLLVVTFLGVFKPEFFGRKEPNLCSELNKRKDLMTARIEDLGNKKSNCTNKDSIEKYYDFEINYANAELQNIKDSLKSCSN